MINNHDKDNSYLWEVTFEDYHDVFKIKVIGHYREEVMKKIKLREDESIIGIVRIMKVNIT